jgi:hypothetical protein
MRWTKERFSSEVWRLEAGQDAKGSTSFRKVEGKKVGKRLWGTSSAYIDQVA